MQRRHNELVTLDDAILGRLAEVMEEEFLDLLETYLRNVPLELARLSTAMTTKQIEPIYASAHAIKGSSANLGLLRLSALCLELERLSRTGGVLTEEARALHGDIIAEFDQVRSLLEQRMAQL